MEAIKVTASFDEQGRVRPVSFIWQGRLYRVDSVGRRWEGSDGQHILVLTVDNRAHHLLYQPESSRWYRLYTGDEPTIPLL